MYSAKENTSPYYMFCQSYLISSPGDPVLPNAALKKYSDKKKYVTFFCINLS